MYVPTNAIGTGMPFKKLAISQSEEKEWAAPPNVMPHFIHNIFPEQ
jgi:hypothetical protein